MLPWLMPAMQEKPQICPVVIYYFNPMCYEPVAVLTLARCGPSAT